MEDLISIGQLSSDIGISIRAIRYYEEVGFFKPAATTESKYRYYGPHEIEKLRIIIFLKKMGFSLQEIKTVLTENRKLAIMNMIGQHQKKVDMELNQMLEKKEILRELFESIGGSNQASPLAVIKEVSLNQKEHIHMVLKDNLPIKVIGVGKGSINAVNKLVENGAKMDFIYVDSDKQSISGSKAYCNIHVGDQLGETADREMIKQIKQAVKGSDILFILAYMDSEIASSAAPVIAQEARKMGILTVGVIADAAMMSTGITRKIAETGAQNLRNNVDMLFNLPSITGQANSEWDELAHNAVHCLSSLITAANLVDMEDMKFLIREKGSAHIGIGRAAGPYRAKVVVDQVLNSPTLVDDISKADSIIVNITGSNDMQISEVNLIAETVLSRIKSEAKMIFGTVIDHDVKDSLIVTVVTAGIEARE